MFKDEVQKIYRYSEPNLSLVGWLGFIGFPLYYFMWHDIFPQPYENIWLRLFGSILLVTVALRKHLPSFVQPYLPYHYLFTISYTLPFFFCYMMFKNEWTTVWVTSFMASIFLHILLVHTTRVMMLQSLSSIGVAYFCAYGSDWYKFNEHITWSYVPVFVFTYIFGNLFFFRNQAEHESKMSIAKYFGAGIAHEMRNPLSALRASNDVLSSVLPKLDAHGTGEFVMTKEEVILAKEVLNDANNVIESGNETIDMLLTSIDQSRIATGNYVKHSIKEVVCSAVDGFSYKSLVDRQAVKVNVRQDFAFLGSDTLFKYVIYNLLKNAFYHQGNTGFSIVIEIEADNGYNCIRFRDNGLGIKPEVMEHIFEDFYSTGKRNSYGLGLPFCKKVMQAMGGEISCRSRLGAWTEFSLSFSDYDSAEVLEIKKQLVKNKSVMYIGSKQQVVFKILNSQSFYLGYHFTAVTVEQACQRSEYEFEYPLIFVDLDEFSDKPQRFRQLEKLLHFTEARLVFLYNSSNRYLGDYDRHLSFAAVEKSQLIDNVKKHLFELFFENSNQHFADRTSIPKLESVSGKTILIADDNQSLRVYTAILLGQQGFNVLQAKTGLEVLTQLESNSIDLIIMDIAMPEMDGLDTTKAIRKLKDSRSAAIPIIGYTGSSSTAIIKKIHQANMTDYIVKPAATEKLLDKIADWI
ncbi:ATP-binding response regulator [Vibrio hippocampi]|nr:hybrid sensor histidine kinase/response regulator [Vibrio hippocampi]